MGVKNLWRTISPYGQKVSVVELQGKQVAVDLSGWICENQIVGEKHMSQQSKFHLRNIFFRTAVLLMSNVTPLFILDGDPPDIKQSTLSKRNQTRFDRGNGKDIEGEINTSKQRGQRKVLKYTLRECEELLNLLGLTCFWSEGEGEAFCALLDYNGVVDGVITQDSDAFLYGARKVYRNFTSQCGFGSLELYEMSDLEKHLNLSREKLIAMSLLCGCDYDEMGIHGFGPETSLKYLSNFEGDILMRLQSLRTDKQLQMYEIERNSCKRCHHLGKQQDHTKLGCELCGTHRKCIQSQIMLSYDSLSVEEKSKIDFELKLRKEIKSKTSFPDAATINEYLNFSQEIPRKTFEWKKPNIIRFITFMEKKCKWNASYGFEKIIPVYCRWALINSEFNDFSPCKILKKRVLKAVPSFDVQWISRIDLNLNFDFEDNTTNTHMFTTIEPQALVLNKCKKLYDDFVAEVANKKLAMKKKKSTSRKKAVKDMKNDLDVKDLIEGVGRLSLTQRNSSQSSKTSRENEKIKSNHFVRLDKENNMTQANLSRERTLKSVLPEENLEEKDYETDFTLNDSVTVDYSISEYEIDESFILNSIIARRQYY